VYRVIIILDFVVTILRIVNIIIIIYYNNDELSMWGGVVYMLISYCFSSINHGPTPYDCDKREFHTIIHDISAIDKI
jgi:hypothetical protein